MDADGVPTLEHPSVQEYVARQAAMISHEKKSRSDFPFRQTLSETAKAADRLVAKIRQDEIEHVWTVSGTPTKAERYAGEMFPLARPIIQGTKLWKIIQRMPKGALLHAHFGALVPFDISFEIIIRTPGMHISSDIDLSSKNNLDIAIVHFTYVKPTTDLPETGSIWTKDYAPKVPVPLTLAADSCPFGGRAAFLKFLKSTVTLSSEECLRKEFGVNAIWRKFERVFLILGSTYSYEPLFRSYLRQLFNALIDDGIQFVELRQTFSIAHITREGEEIPETTPEYVLEVIAEELRKFQATSKGKNFWGLRCIWSGLRAWGKESTIADMKNCLAYKKKSPYLIAGYDVVGQEDSGRSLKSLAPELLWFDSQRRSQSLEIPYFFHAGETLGDGTEADDNLFDALLFQSRRVGHGMSLYKHPHLMQAYREKSVLVEVCPISNEVLRLCTDILHHPLPALIAHGVPTAISNDDPNVEGQDAAGLSFDFYQAIQGFDNLGLAGLGALAENSVRWANFEDQNHAEWIRDIEAGNNGDGIKAKCMREWKAQWEEFCEWVVAEYGE